MSQKPHGVAIIINNVHFFDPKVLSTRDGSDTDSNNLERTLKGLGYKPVMVLEDRKGDQITRAFRDVCEMDHSKHDSFVCCLLSHGMEGAVYGKDGQLVKIRDLSKKLARCEGLQGKPKIFFIQTCQGSDKPEELKKTTTNMIQTKTSLVFLVIGISFSDMQLLRKLSPYAMK